MSKRNKSGLPVHRINYIVYESTLEISYCSVVYIFYITRSFQSLTEPTLKDLELVQSFFHTSERIFFIDPAHVSFFFFSSLVNRYF